MNSTFCLHELDSCFSVNIDPLNNGYLTIIKPSGFKINFDISYFPEMWIFFHNCFRPIREENSLKMCINLLQRDRKKFDPPSSMDAISRCFGAMQTILECIQDASPFLKVWSIKRKWCEIHKSCKSSNIALHGNFCRRKLAVYPALSVTINRKRFKVIKAFQRQW